MDIHRECWQSEWTRAKSRLYLNVFDVALCHPDRDRRDKPGDEATSFAPVAFSQND
jgi:hypothetical protein